MKALVARLETELAEARAAALAAKQTVAIFANPNRFASPEMYLKALTAALHRQSLMVGVQPPHDIPNAFDRLSTADELAARRGLAHIKSLKEAAGRWGS